MSGSKRFTNANGAPVADNTNIMTAGPRGPARGRVRRHQTDDDQQRCWEHQNDSNRLPPFEHSPRDKVGGPIISRHEPSKTDYRSYREGAPIAVFAQYPDRTVAHRSAGDAKMNTGEEERSQDQ